MKKLLNIVFVIFMCGVVYGQPKVNKPVSVVSENRDTLFLTDNRVGKVIQGVWDSCETKKPLIFLKPECWILSETIRRKKTNKRKTESKKFYSGIQTD